MPLFGFRTHKKYDKDFSQAKAVKVDPKKPIKEANVVKDAKVLKEKTTTKIVALPESSRIKNIPTGTFSSFAGIIIRPHVTEKTGTLSQRGAYTFQVDRNANKQTIAKAIKELYKVNPVKISIVRVSAKNIFVRGKKGTVPGMKKAIVTVKKGEKIDFV